MTQQSFLEVLFYPLWAPPQSEPEWLTRNLPLPGDSHPWPGGSLTEAAGTFCQKPKGPFPRIAQQYHYYVKHNKIHVRRLPQPPEPSRGEVWEGHLWLGSALSFPPAPPREAMEARDAPQFPRQQSALTRIARPPVFWGDIWEFYSRGRLDHLRFQEVPSTIR